MSDKNNKTPADNSTDNLSPNDLILNYKSYAIKCSEIIQDAVYKGADILQFSNGDLELSEVKIVTYKYTWNNERLDFERVSTPSRYKKKKSKQSEK